MRKDTRFFRSLEKQVSPEMVREKILKYWYGIQVRKLLVQGSICRTEKYLKTIFYPHIPYYILVAQHTPNIDQLTITLWHELIHTLLKEDSCVRFNKHDEGKVEWHARRLAKRQPCITKICEEIFKTDFSFPLKISSYTQFALSSI